jgi:hypothetical protein
VQLTLALQDMSNRKIRFGLWRWLDARQPDPEEVRQALGRIVRDGTRAGDLSAASVLS